MQNKNIIPNWILILEKIKEEIQKNEVEKDESKRSAETVDY